MKVHHVKSHIGWFTAIRCGVKTFECRVNDRDYKEGDALVLEEYDPAEKCYTGPKEVRVITKVDDLRSLPGIAEAWPSEYAPKHPFVILSLRKVDGHDTETFLKEGIV